MARRKARKAAAAAVALAWWRFPLSALRDGELSYHSCHGFGTDSLPPVNCGGPGCSKGIPTGPISNGAEVEGTVAAAAMAGRDAVMHACDTIGGRRWSCS